MPLAPRETPRPRIVALAIIAVVLIRKWLVSCRKERTFPLRFFALTLRAFFRFSDFALQALLFLLLGFYSSSLLCSNVVEILPAEVSQSSGYAFLLRMAHLLRLPVWI